MFAIIDIETTGGFGTQNCITEIAIILHNGKEIEGKYQTLINPERPIQRNVQSMTGITNAMVYAAPKFNDVAANIYNLIKDRVFVAHNVNFDYSFVKSHLKTAGYEIDLPKICTVKLSRKIFPGLLKYGLGSLSNHFNIPNEARHRAIGDAQATTTLFELIVANDATGEIEKLIKKRKQAQYLPPNLATNVITQMPSLPGVYYFYNNKQKVVYVGKAINLKKRVSSHFSNNNVTKQKQDFLKEIYNITWQNCSSDLTAQIFESIEIKRLWPQFNKSQKQYERQYCIFMFDDALGFKRLAIDNKKKIIKPVATFALIVETRQFLRQLCDDFDIHSSMFFLSKEFQIELPKIEEHNAKINKIVAIINKTKQTYLVHDGAANYVLIEDGKFWGMGKIERLENLLYKNNLEEQIKKTKKEKATSKRKNISVEVNENNKAETLYSIELIKQNLTQYPENFTVLSYINNYVFNNPSSVILL